MIYSWKRPQSVRCHAGGLEKKSDSITFPPMKAFWFFLKSNGKWNVLYFVNMSNRSLPTLTTVSLSVTTHTILLELSPVSETNYQIGPLNPSVVSH